MTNQAFIKECEEKIAKLSPENQKLCRRLIRAIIDTLLETAEKPADSGLLDDTYLSEDAHGDLSQIRERDAASRDEIDEIRDREARDGSSDLS